MTKMKLTAIAIAITLNACASLQSAEKRRGVEFTHEDFVKWGLAADTASECNEIIKYKCSKEYKAAKRKTDVVLGTAAITGGQAVIIPGDNAPTKPCIEALNRLAKSKAEGEDKNSFAISSMYIMAIWAAETGHNCFAEGEMIVAGRNRCMDSFMAECAVFLNGGKK